MFGFVCEPYNIVIDVLSFSFPCSLIIAFCAFPHFRWLFKRKWGRRDTLFLLMFANFACIVPLIGWIIWWTTKETSPESYDIQSRTEDALHSFTDFCYTCLKRVFEHLHPEESMKVFRIFVFIVLWLKLLCTCYLIINPPVTELLCYQNM